MSAHVNGNGWPFIHARRPPPIVPPPEDPWRSLVMERTGDRLAIAAFGSVHLDVTTMRAIANMILQVADDIDRDAMDRFATTLISDKTAEKPSGE